MPPLRRSAGQKGVFSTVKVADRFRPLFFLWLPWCILLVMAAVGVRYLPEPLKEPQPRSVTREVPRELTFSAKAASEKKVWVVGNADAFLRRRPSMVEVQEPAESLEEPLRQGVTVRVSGVVIGSRVRSGVINGVPYVEGDVVPEAGRVENIQHRGVTIVGENGQRVFVGVGQRVDI